VNTPVEFLRLIYPAGPWAVQCFDPEGKPPHTKVFGPTTEAECADYITRANTAGWNVYYHVSEPRPDIQKKATKEDILKVHFLWADLDPRAGESLSSERQRIAALLTTTLPPEVPAPTFVIDSGSGYQSLWWLSAPVELGPAGMAADEIERYTRWLEIKFGSDKVHNVDRVLRMPFTINHPDAKKRAKGRVPSPAKLELCEPGRVYDLSAFRQAPPKLDTLTKDAKDDAPAAILRVLSVDELPAKVSGRAKVVILHGDDPDDSFALRTGTSGRSEAVFYVCCELVRAGCNDGTIAGVLLNRDFPISAHVYDQPKPQPYALAQARKARAEVAKGQAGAANSHASGNDERPTTRDMARGLLKRRGAPLIHLNDDYYIWSGGAYLAQEENTLRAEAYAYLESISAKPGKGMVSNVLDALCSLVHLERSKYTPPCWTNDRAEPDPRQMLVCQNGLLHLPTGQLLPHSPEFLTHNALDYEFDPKAATPTHWLEFLSQIWPAAEEADCIAALQQWFGYLLTPDTSQQKILVLVGPKRSGRGTIARVLTGLLGQHNVCAPRLSQFGANFGLQSLIAKQVALISDLRLGGKADKAAIAEALLAISGEDRITIDRKNRDFWIGQLQARFVIMSNEPPVLPDPSGALPSRFIVIEMRESFYGREDTRLTERLLAERPGILNWAIAGWQALQAAGRLTQPQSSADTVRQIERGSSEVLAFAEDCCEFIPDAQENKDTLYHAFMHWARREGMTYFPKKEQFSKELLSAFRGKVRSSQPRGPDGKARRVYQGIKLLAECRSAVLDAPREPATTPVAEDLPF